MDLRRWVYEKLSRGQVDDVDPDEPLTVAVVMNPEGPMLVSALQATGLHAVGIPSWNVGTRWSDRTEVVVPRREVPAAEAVLKDLRDQSPGTYLDWVLDRRVDESGTVLSSEGHDERDGGTT